MLSIEGERRNNIKNAILDKYCIEAFLCAISNKYLTLVSADHSIKFWHYTISDV